MVVYNALHVVVYPLFIYSHQEKNCKSGACINQNYFMARQFKSRILFLTQSGCNYNE